MGLVLTIPQGLRTSAFAVKVCMTAKYISTSPTKLQCSARTQRSCYVRLIILKASSAHLLQTSRQYTGKRIVGRLKPVWPADTPADL